MVEKVELHESNEQQNDWIESIPFSDNALSESAWIIDQLEVSDGLDPKIKKEIDRLIETDETGLYIGWFSSIKKISKIQFSTMIQYIKKKWYTFDVVSISWFDDTLPDNFNKLVPTSRLTIDNCKNALKWNIKLPPTRSIEIRDCGDIEFHQPIEAEYISLQGSNIDTLSKMTFSHLKTERISIKHCNIYELPKELHNACNSKINSLEIHSGHLCALPDRVWELQHLEELSVTYNELTTLPDSIGNTWWLLRLNLSNNQLTDLPTALQICSDLREINITRNNMSVIPDFINTLPKLNNLNVSHNPISKISLKNSSSIKDLSLAQTNINNLWNLPNSITNLNLFWLPLDEKIESIIKLSETCNVYISNTSILQLNDEKIWKILEKLNEQNVKELDYRIKINGWGLLNLSEKEAKALLSTNLWKNKMSFIAQTLPWYYIFLLKEAKKSEAWEETEIDIAYTRTELTKNLSPNAALEIISTQQMQYESNFKLLFHRVIASDNLSQIIESHSSRKFNTLTKIMEILPRYLHVRGNNQSYIKKYINAFSETIDSEKTYLWQFKKSSFAIVKILKSDYIPDNIKGPMKKLLALYWNIVYKNLIDFTNKPDGISQWDKRTIFSKKLYLYTLHINGIRLDIDDKLLCEFEDHDILKSLPEVNSEKTLKTNWSKKSPWISRLYFDHDQDWFWSFDHRLRTIWLHDKKEISKNWLTYTLHIIKKWKKKTIYHITVDNGTWIINHIFANTPATWDIEKEIGEILTKHNINDFSWYNFVVDRWHSWKEDDAINNISEKTELLLIWSCWWAREIWNALNKKDRLPVIATSWTWTKAVNDAYFWSLSQQLNLWKVINWDWWEPENDFIIDKERYIKREGQYILPWENTFEDYYDYFVRYFEKSNEEE